MKARSDSKLKTLPEERQEQIIAWAKTPKSETCVGGLAYALEQLAADGIKVSISTLSEFVSWWSLRARYLSADARAKQVEELLKSKDPSMTPERIRELGQALFTMEALDSGDAETFVNLEHLKLKQDSAKFKGSLDLAKYKLDREKFEVESCKRFLSWFKDARAREIADSGLSNADKIARLRETYFADVDKLEAEGGIHLPE
ncbi:MAG: hypothetical protein WCO94_05895 [Verrucomicrobiota bacterium]